MFRSLMVWWLSRLLASRTPRVRINAVRRLGKIEERHAVDRLITALHDHDTDVRSAAIESLGNIGDARAVDHLIVALDDRDADICSAAIESLGKLGDARAVEPLLRILSNRWHSAQRRAAQSLGKLRDLRAVEPLLRALGHADGDVRLGAAEALEQLGKCEWKPLIKGEKEDFRRLSASGNPHALQLLKENLLFLPPDLCQVACEAIAKIPDLGAVDYLISRMRITGKETASLRKIVASVLAGVNDPRVFDCLVTALDDSEPDVVLAAVDSLSKLDPCRAVEVLVQCLWRRPDAVYQAAAEALAQLGEPKWKSLIRDDSGYLCRREYLGRLLETGDPRVLDAAMRFPFSDPRQGEGDKVVVAKALGNIRDPRAVDALVQALCESSSDVCKAAAKSLAKLVNPNALEILIETLGDANKFRVVAAMQALADVHEPRTMEVIIDLLDDDDGDSYISGMAASALSEYLSDPRAEDASVRALGHRDRSVREKAAWGLKWQKASRQEGSEDPARADASEWNSLVEDVYTGGYAVYDLKDKHEYSEDDYIHRLTRFRDPRALEPLVRMLQYRHYYKSTAAVARALGERGDLRAVEPLLRALCPFGKRV